MMLHLLRVLPEDILTRDDLYIGLTYFFKNNHFWRFDDAKVKADGPNQVTATRHWFGCNN